LYTVQYTVCHSGAVHPVVDENIVIGFKMQLELIIIQFSSETVQ